jgi:large subunit ribosomal protein L24
MPAATQAKLRKAPVKKGDRVQVISGKAKGQTGEVLRVNLLRSTVLIKEVNMVQRHTKPRRQGQPGGIMPMEAPIHISNVLKFCEHCERGVRKLCSKQADCRYYKARRGK